MSNLDVARSMAMEPLCSLGARNYFPDFLPVISWPKLLIVLNFALSFYLSTIYDPLHFTRINKCLSFGTDNNFLFVDPYVLIFLVKFRKID